MIINWELERKVQEAITLLKRGEPIALAMQPDEGYWVAFSGGKDSIVMLDLVQRAGVKYTAYYNVTGNDAPANVYFIRQHYPEVKFWHPKKKFIQLITRMGMPTINRRNCCERLKERSGGGFAVLTGVRADESRKRAEYGQIDIRSRRKVHEGKDKRRTMGQLEQTYHECIKGKDKLMIRPIYFFTESEIWEYIANRNLPVNPLYAKCGRVGCMFCPFSNTGQLDYYERTYPKFKVSIIHRLDKFVARRPDARLKGGQQVYDWWRSHKTVDKFLAEN